MPKDVSNDTETTMIRAQATRVSRRAVSTSTTTVQVKEAKRKVKTTSKVTTVASASTSNVTQDGDLDAITTAQLGSLEHDTMGKSWLEVLKGEFEKDYFKKLKSFLETELKSNTVFPPLKDVYSWSRLTPLDSVKVVILGQVCHSSSSSWLCLTSFRIHIMMSGKLMVRLSFSVLPPTKVPGSLRNIYKQMATDVPSFVIPKNSGDLTRLAEIGVLWLNTALTVGAHKAASHSGKGWENLTMEAVRAVMNREGSNGVVFMAWGLPAQKTCGKLGIDEEKHLVLKSAHPSPLSAHRGFLGNGHFRLANEWLQEKYGDDGTIDWTVLCG
ncbi:uracil DNA glycosylase [Marasmius crinis-equi]|uniref:Uracil DNA glycosylase n=1 Tax=Marasmius crinis-equi TaxID=585013 RepID=A0ABR3FGU7_9AGAR